MNGKSIYVPFGDSINNACFIDKRDALFFVNI